MNESSTVLGVKQNSFILFLLSFLVNLFVESDGYGESGEMNIINIDEIVEEQHKSTTMIKELGHVKCHRLSGKFGHVIGAGD